MASTTTLNVLEKIKATFPFITGIPAVVTTSGERIIKGNGDHGLVIVDKMTWTPILWMVEYDRDDCNEFFLEVIASGNTSGFVDLREGQDESSPHVRDIHVFNS